MEEWEHNLALESEESSGGVGPNLVFEGESSGGVGPNVIIGVVPVPKYVLPTVVPQAPFPVQLLEGRVIRRERKIPFFARIDTVKLRMLRQEALPPSLFSPRVTIRGKGRNVTWTKVFQQHYRVADDSLDRYELYVEEDQLPDFDASDQPVATSATLPFSFMPDLPSSAGDTKEYWVVVRKRSRYDLLSFNLHPTKIMVDSLGDEDVETSPISVPVITRVMDGESGEIIVFARYPYGVDRHEADTWELYVEEGVDPDPLTDTIRATDSFGSPAADYQWRTSLSGLTPGSTYHVMVVVRRSEDSGSGEEGQSAVSQITLAETYDMEESTTWLFGGQDHEIGQ